MLQINDMWVSVSKQPPIWIGRTFERFDYSIIVCLYVSTMDRCVPKKITSSPSSFISYDDNKIENQVLTPWHCVRVCEMWILCLLFHCCCCCIIKAPWSSRYHISLCFFPFHQTYFLIMCTMCLQPLLLSILPTTPATHPSHHFPLRFHSISAHLWRIRLTWLNFSHVRYLNWTDIPFRTFNVSYRLMIERYGLFLYIRMCVVCMLHWIHIMCVRVCVCEHMWGRTNKQENWLPSNLNSFLFTWLLLMSSTSSSSSAALSLLLLVLSMLMMIFLIVSHHQRLIHVRAPLTFLSDC